MGNLIKPDKERARKLGARGGIASGEARRNKKVLRDTLETLLDMPISGGTVIDIKEIQSIAALEGASIDVHTAIALQQVKRAMHGDVRAAVFIRDTIGQKPAYMNAPEPESDGFIDALKEAAKLIKE